MLDRIKRNFLLTDIEIRIIRYTFGATLSMAIGMGIGWPFSYLATILTLNFLSSPESRPSFKSGVIFLLVIATVNLLALLLGKMLLPYILVFVLFVGYLLFLIYYLHGSRLSPSILLWMMIALLTIPLVIMEYNGVAIRVAESLIISGSVALLVTWISYFIFPDRNNNGNNGKAKNNIIPKEQRLLNALKSTIVVYPILLVFYFFQLSGALLVLIYIAILSNQPEFAKDFNKGKFLIIGNFIGGVTAILVYEILVIVPEYTFMLFIIFLFGLLFGRKYFSQDKLSALFGMAYSTLVLIIGSVTGTFDAEANTKVYFRVAEIMIAVIYLVTAFGIVEYLFSFTRKRKNYKIALLGIVIPLFFTSCTVGPDFVRPNKQNTNFDIANYRMDFPSSESIAEIPWWEMFGDSVLQNLISDALKNNRDLKSAMFKIDEARANLNIVRADLYPRLDYGINTAYEGTSDNNFSGNSSLAISASYQIDLWGKIKRMNEAALQEYFSTEEAYRTATITLVAEVASTYFLLRDIDNRLLIAERTAETRKKSLDVIKARYEAGIVAEVDVNQAEIQLADAEASVKSFIRLRGQTENAISLLLSNPPMKIPRGKVLQEQIFPPEIPIGLPSALLNRRPDLLEAERKLHAQTERIGIAEALKYPQISLSADLGASFSNLTTGFAGLGAQILGPLFNSGANQSRVEIEIARTKQLLNKYEQTFYNALREVEDAMIAVRTYEEEYKVRKEQMNSAQNATNLSWIRYEGGMTSYLEVLDLQRSLFTAQLKTSEALQLHLNSVVKLYNALGGGWDVSMDEKNNFTSRKKRDNK